MAKKSLWDNSSLQQDIKWDNQELPGCPDEVLLTKNWNVVDANRQIVKNRLKNDWLEKNRQAIKNRKPGYGEKISKTSKELRNNKEWKKSWLKTIEERNNNIEYQEKTKEAIKKRTSDPLWLEKNRQASKKKYKKIQTPHGVFESINDAIIFYNKLKNVKNCEDWLRKQRKKYPEKYYIIDNR
jgi:hypothetical protein